MIRTKKPFLTIIRLLPILLLTAGCSQLIFTDEADEGSIISENALMTKGGGSNVFYYYFDEKINLEERGELMCVRFKDNDSRKGFIDELCSSPSLISVWDPDLNKAYYRENSKNILLLQSNNGGITKEIFEGINGRDDVEYVSHVYGSQKNVSTVTDEFSVYLRSLSDYGKLEELAATYGCTVAHREWFDEKTYFVRRPKDSKYSTIDLAALFYETGQFEFTSPDFIAFNVLCSNDTYYPYQWGLKNTGQISGSVAGRDIDVERAWNVTEGSSDIIIAILDDGVDRNHPDLEDNLMTGYDAIHNTLGGGHTENDGGHGTAVAGIIGAVKDNEIGIAGVAPACKIVPVRIIDEDGLIEDSDAVSAFNWCVNLGVDVINCSWLFWVPSSLLSTAIHNATTQGRNGKGCVVVFASGNSSLSSVSYPSSLDDVVSVGACGPDGLRCNFSNYGTGLDVVAPGSGIWTTARDSSYFSISGTSVSAPFVSGIAALVLSKYPDLKQEQVRRAIELGCSKYSGYSYSLDNSYPTGSWNSQMGYGIVNAYYSLVEASYAHQSNITDGISGFDFTVMNHSSYDVWALFVGLTGDISYSTSETLIFQDPGDVASGRQVGYPLYRGEDIFDTPGTPISNIQLEFYAMTPFYSGPLRIGAAIDNTSPPSYTGFTFGDGDTIFLDLQNSTVPNASRRHVYIDIQDPLPRN